MKFKDNYYRLVGVRNEGAHSLFSIALLPDCELYRGHFPGDPVCPGVCSIELIRQCAECLEREPLFIHRIKQCRFTVLLSPATYRELTVDLSLSPTGEEKGVLASARIYDERNVYVEFKGEMLKRGRAISG